MSVAAAECDSVARQRSSDCLRILLAAWAPFHAGAEVAAERLAIGLRDFGYQVTVLLGTDGETFARMRESGLDVRHVPLAMTDKRHWFRYRRAQREVRRLIDEIRPDVVHANDLPTSQMIAQAAGQAGVPRVCHHRWVFGGEAIDWLNKYGAERHLFVSGALMDDLCRASPRLAGCARAVVYDGLPLPPAPQEADRVQARRDLGLPSSSSVVLFAGQIIERKGVADLLRAWHRLPAVSAEQAELIIVGDDLEAAGAYRRQMEALAAELNCRARFVGFQRNVPQWLTAADVCVVPSHVEPLGNATLEAMAHARPVIGSRVGGIPEMIDDGQTGLLITPRDPGALSAALQTLLEAPALRQRLGEAARVRCEERFSLRAHVDAVLQQYRLVLEAKRAAS